MGTVAQAQLNQARRLAPKERLAEAIILRRKGLSLTAIADKLGVSYALIQRDLSKYLRRLDEECMKNMEALRAEQFEKLQKYADHLQDQILNQGQTGRIDSAIKTSESIRRLYAMDIQPVKKAEVTHRKELMVELITTLRSELPAHIFGEVLNTLTRSDDFNYLGGAIEASGTQRNTTDQSQLRRLTPEEGDSTTNSQSEINCIDSEEAIDSLDIS